MDALRGQQRVGVGVGGSGGSGVGVDPGTGGGDVAGGEAAADGDAGLGEVADAVGTTAAWSSSSALQTARSRAPSYWRR